MDQITHEVRLARWKEVIKQCQSRPEGHSIPDPFDRGFYFEKSIFPLLWQPPAQSCP